MTGISNLTTIKFTGMSLELGLALFLHGCPFFHKSARHLMGVAYTLLQREPFQAILKVSLIVGGAYSLMGGPNIWLSKEGRKMIP